MFNFKEFLQRKPSELKLFTESQNSTPATNQAKYGGEILLKIIGADESDAPPPIFGIPYSTTSIPIFQDFSEEDYKYYGSIPSM